MNNSLITVEVSTKNRYEILHLALFSIAAQTYPPAKFILFDDSDEKLRQDLRNISIYKNIFKLFDKRGIEWQVIFSPQHGQVKNHIQALDLCRTPYIFRMDDDNILSNNTLEVLLNVIEKDDKIGAAGCFVEHPDIDFPECVVSPLIEDVLFKYAIQFHKFEGVRETNHLYSTFLSRVSAAKNCYPTNLSKISHREESTFSIKLYKKGYKLLVTGDTRIYHLRGEGGIRTFNKKEDERMWADDEIKFRERLNAWGIKLNEYFVIVLNGAAGDNYAFRPILSDIRKKYKNKKIFLATVFPDIWVDEPDIDIASIAGARILLGDISKWDVYKKGYDSGGSLSLIDAYRKIYDV